MDESQNSEKKPQLSWAQPISSVKPSPLTGNSTPTVQAKPQMSGNQNHTTRNLVIAAVAILVVVGIAWLIRGDVNPATDTGSSNTIPAGTNTNTSGTGAQTGAPSSNAQVSFPSGTLVVSSPQNAGLEVAVLNVVVQVPTWVVVYENYNGQPGNVLGAALFTSDRSSGAIDLLRGTLPGQSYFAGEARDDGDHMFSMVNDPSIRDASGNPITLKFETK